MDIYKSLLSKIDRSNDNSSLQYRTDLFINRHKKTILEGLGIIILAIIILGTTIIVFG